MHKKELLGEQELAYMLSVSVSTIRGLIRDGQLAHPVVVKGKKRFLRRDVDAFLDQLPDVKGCTPKKRGRTSWDIPCIPVSMLKWQAKLQEYEGHLLPPCVYFLIKDDELVYIGQTTNLAGRIDGHRKGSKATPKKEFDRVLFIECDRQLLTEKEGYFIWKLNPCLNKNRGSMRHLMRSLLETKEAAEQPQEEPGLPQHLARPPGVSDGPATPPAETPTA